jgi:hypothetical protein
MSVRHRFLSLLVLLTVLLRSVVPAGFMPAPRQAGDGKMTIVICTGHGEVRQLSDLDGQTPPNDQGKNDNSLCLYATAGAFAINAEVQDHLLGEVRYAPVSYSLADQFLNVAPRSDTRSARAPPSKMI